MSFISNNLTQLRLARRPRHLARLVATAGLLLALAACGGGSSSTTPVVPAPAISNFTPTSGSAGAGVTITGANLNGASAVAFGGKAASTFTVNSATQITATVASSTTTGAVTVTTPGGTAASAGMFTVLAPPVISSFAPTSGPVGTSVVITGTSFTGATAVAFNGKAASAFTVNSVTKITATVASGTTTGLVSVTTPLGAANSASNFTVTAALPAISSFSPANGPVGTSVTITGSNFTGATAVAFNGKAASAFTVNSSTQITATVATATTSGKITVTTPAGTATSANTFTVTSSGALDLSIDGLYVTQATQDYPDPIVPLVKDRSAWVRVFVIANQANTATPQVKVDFTTGGTTHTLTINAGASSVPLSADPANAAASWNAAVPAAWMQPSTQVVATVDPTNAIAEADETNNTFTQSLDVRNLKVWKVTLVPVHTKDGNVGVVENGTRTKNDWLDFAKRLHPVPDAIDVTVGGVMNSSVTTLVSDGTGWDTVLLELRTKRTTDGATDRYYYGAVHTTYGSGVAGLGYIGLPAAIGWDVTGSFPAVLAHEEGHNFNRPHSPCGGVTGADPNYPYPGGVIGVPGWDVFAASNNLKAAATYTDIMGYCSNQWISDYVYVSELTFRQNSPIGIIVPGPDGAAVAGDGLLVWGQIENNQVTLEPAFRVPVKNNQPQSGPYTWEVRDALGRVLASVSFDAAEVADLPDRSVQMFSFIAPLGADALQAIQTMHVKSGQQELARRAVSAGSAEEFTAAVDVQDLPNGGAQVVWDADRYPVLMLRDARTGEVRGFLRGGNAQIVQSPKEIEIRAPDAARGEKIRHTRIVE